nr:BCCT family transporter [Lysobacter soli]
MGIGLVFWGAAEPLSHYASPRGNPAGHGRRSPRRDALRLLPLGTAPVGDLCIDGPRDGVGPVQPQFTRTDQ